MKNYLFILCLFLCGLFSHAQGGCLEPVIWQQPCKNDTIVTLSDKVSRYVLDADSLTVKRFNEHIALLKTLKQKDAGNDFKEYKILFTREENGGIHYAVKEHFTNRLSIAEAAKDTMFKMPDDKNIDFFMAVFFGQGKYAVVTITTNAIGSMYEYSTRMIYYLQKVK